MEKKSNGKVIFITALISVITTLVLVIGGFFAFQVISSSNSMDGYYENERYDGNNGDYYNIEIKGEDAIVTWNRDNYTGKIFPKAKTIKLSGGKELKYTFKLGTLVIEDDDATEKGEQLIFDKKDKEKALKEREERREKEKKELKEELKEEKKSSSSSSDD